MLCWIKDNLITVLLFSHISTEGTDIKDWTVKDVENLWTNQKTTL